MRRRHRPWRGSQLRVHPLHQRARGGEIDLRGTIAYCGDCAAAIKLVQDGKVDLKPFITGRIALDDLVDKGFDTLISHNDTAVTTLR